MHHTTYHYISLKYPHSVGFHIYGMGCHS
uniref:Uncharacterized protein n=1 Tax=Anguilla anguilla TaxID=7936 RepID=A0A0E9W4L3_ANGAN